MPSRPLGSFSQAKLQRIRLQPPAAQAPRPPQPRSQSYAYREPNKAIDDFKFDVSPRVSRSSQRPGSRRNDDVAPGDFDRAVLRLRGQGAAKEELVYSATEADIRSDPAEPGPGSRGSDIYNPGQPAVYGPPPSTSLAIQPVRVHTSVAYSLFLIQTEGPAL
jgi:hypothetical protein